MAGADEGSRIRDVVRGSKIRLHILRKLDRQLGSYKSELNQGTIEIQNCSEQFQSHGRVLPRSAKGVEDCTYIGRLGRNRSPTAGSERRSNLQEANRRWVRSYLPLFKRTSNKEDLFNWFDAVDHFFEKTQQPETMKFELASYVLDGEAERWWQNFQQQRLLYGESEIKLWPRMKFILSNDFWPAKCSTNFPNQLNKLEGKEVVKHTKSDGPSHADYLIEVPLESFNSGKNQIDCWGSTNEFHYSNSSTTDVCENTKCGVLPSEPAEHDKVVDDTDINLQQSVNCYTVGAIEFAANNLDMKKTTYAFEPPTTTPLVASAKSMEEEIPIVAETSEGITGHIQPESKFHSPELLVCVGECDDKRKADQTIGVETEYGMVEELGREAPIVTLPNAKVHQVNEVLHSQLDGCDTERYKIGVVPVLIAFDGDRIERLRNSFGATILPLARDQRLLYVVVHESSTHSVKPHFQFVEPNSDLNSANVNLKMMLPELSVGDLIGRCGPNTSRIDEYVYSLMMLETGAILHVHIIPGSCAKSMCTVLKLNGENLLMNFDPGGKWRSQSTKGDNHEKLELVTEFVVLNMKSGIHQRYDLVANRGMSCLDKPLNSWINLIILNIIKLDSKFYVPILVDLGIECRVISLHLPKMISDCHVFSHFDDNGSGFTITINEHIVPQEYYHIQSTIWDVNGFNTKSQPCICNNSKWFKLTLATASFSNGSILLGEITTVVSIILGKAPTTCAIDRILLEVKNRMEKAFTTSFSSITIMKVLITTCGHLAWSIAVAIVCKLRRQKVIIGIILQIHQTMHIVFCKMLWIPNLFRHRIYISLFGMIKLFGIKIYTFVSPWRQGGEIREHILSDASGIMSNYHLIKLASGEVSRPDHHTIFKLLGFEISFQSHGGVAAEQEDSIAVNMSSRRLKVSKVEFLIQVGADYCGTGADVVGFQREP